MDNINKTGTFTLGGRTVNRMGYGAMQLAGAGVFGPPQDRAGAVAVIRNAIESGVNHIDTSDFYGPHITNQIIREALHPYRDDLVIVTKVGAKRDENGSWLPAMSQLDLTQAVHTTYVIWDWIRWKLSICAVCSIRTAPQKAHWRNLWSHCWHCSRRVWCVTLA